MDAQTFLDNFGTIAQTPGGIEKLRDLILDLAKQGRLTERSDDQLESSNLFQAAKADLELLKSTGRVSRHTLGEPLYGSERPDDLPEGWALARFGQVTARVSGNSQLIKGKLESEKALGLFPGYSAAGQDVWLDHFESEGDAAVVSAVGARCGKAFKATDKWSAIANTTVLWPLTSAMTIDYLMLIANNENFWIRSGGAQPFVAFKPSLEQVVWVPPIAEQHRIVAKVDELMALCDQLETQQQTRTQTATKLRASALDALTTAETADELQTAWERIHTNWEALASDLEGVDDLRRLIHMEAVRGGLSKEDESRETLSGLLDWGPAELRLKEENIWSPRLWSRGAPDSWATVPLARLGAWGSGGTPKKHRKDYYGGSIPWFVIGDLNYGILREAGTCITELGLAESSATVVPEGAVLIAMYGASIGKAAITGIECTTNQAIAHCVPDLDLINADYLFLLIRALQDDLVEEGKGMAQPNISQTILKHLLVALPPLAEQHRIVARVDELMALCDELEDRLRERDRVGEALAASVVDAFAA